YDHRRVLASLRTVHGDGVGVREFVEFGEVVGDLLILIGAYAHLLGNRFDARDHAQRAVEHTVLAFFVIVTDLGDLVADLEDTSTETTLGHVVGRGGDGFLQPGVEVDRTGRATLHGGEDLYVPARVEPETTAESASSQGNRKKSSIPSQRGGAPVLIRWALVTTPDCCACRKTWVNRTLGTGEPSSSRSRNTCPAPTEGSWSTSPTNSRCAPGG